MNTVTVNPLDDLDWFACDANGRIAHFASAGFAYVPRSVLMHYGFEETVLKYLQQGTIVDCDSVVPQQVSQIRKLVRTSADSTPFFALGGKRGFDQYTEPFRAFARKGLYSYDSFPVGVSPRGYFLVAKPKQELTVETLPPLFRDAFYARRLNGVCFPKSEQLSVDVLRQITV